MPYSHPLFTFFAHLMPFKLNPDDTLHLVYDSRLLTRTSIVSLNHFCRTHKVIPVDVVTSIKPKCTSKEEREIMALYEAEGLKPPSVQRLQRKLH